MTPQERQLIDDLFDRLARLETAPRDADAERAIAEGLKRAPNAAYALVQTVLVQDEALRRADARIRELSGEEEPAPARGGFLDNMRAMLGGQPGRGSVPSVRPGMSGGGDPRYGAYAAQPASPWGGGSFLGTAAASAAGVIGGALLLNSISSMFGHHGSAFAASPWASGAPGGGSFDPMGAPDVTTASDDFGNDDGNDLSDDSGSDFGGDFGGDGGIDT